MNTTGRYYALPVEMDGPPHGRRGTAESWTKIRERILLRDRGVCHACGRELTRGEYECGHVIDRCVGGTDEDHNLVVMCGLCNGMKPVHETRAAYVVWALDGGGYGDMLRAFKAMTSAESAVQEGSP